MEFAADFHIHSKYSRATSRDMDVENIARWAKLKGITLMGTGDFTHPLWLAELEQKLETAGEGLYKYKDIYFILTAELSNMFSKNNAGRRIHNIIFAPSFEAVKKLNKELSYSANLESDGRPILGIEAKELVKIVLGVSPDCFFVPAHAWTPWFSVFGSMSGFDSVEECFEEESKNIYCLETGLSSDPSMNWRVSALDKYCLISNSDSHSPSRIGREANVFDCELNYYEIIDALKKKDKNRFLYTAEFYPQEGKYHWDGHRNCNVRFSPAQTKENRGICPNCGRRVTVGVEYRVEELADRPAGFEPQNRIPYRNMIALAKIIADAKGIGEETAGVEKEYMSIIQRLGCEFDILFKMSEEDLLRYIPVKVARGIINVRKGNVEILPGYDGTYGTINIFKDADEKTEKQMELF